jgi:hypothetical protein
LASIEEFSNAPLEPLRAPPSVWKAEYDLPTTIQYPAHASEAYLLWDQQQLIITGTYFFDMLWFLSYTAPLAFVTGYLFGDTWEDIFYMLGDYFMEINYMTYIFSYSLWRRSIYLAGFTARSAFQSVLFYYYVG